MSNLIGVFAAVLMIEISHTEAIVSFGEAVVRPIAVVVCEPFGPFAQIVHTEQHCRAVLHRHNGLSVSLPFPLIVNIPIDVSVKEN